MEVRIRKPDDFHVHLREGRLLSVVLPHTTRSFARALVMPNLSDPIDTVKKVEHYRDEILRQAPESFQPLMTIMLTKETTPRMIREAVAADVVACKYYPKGLTTNSEHGVEDILTLAPVLREMEDEGLVLCLHGEQVGAFCIDREEAFLGTVERLASEFPSLRIVLEHISSAAAVELVERLPSTVAASITVHHLELTLDDVIGGHCQPHRFCKPIPKRSEDRTALVNAVRNNQGKFFLGTDSAPHALNKKEASCGCAGIFSAPVAIEVLLDLAPPGVIEKFTSQYGAAFYGLPLNQEYAVYDHAAWMVPDRYPDDEYPSQLSSLYTLIPGRNLDLVPYRAGEMLGWQLRCE